MNTLVLLLPTAALLAWKIAALIRQHAVTFRLLQDPNHRSSHQQPTPHGGGLGIVLASSVAGLGLTLHAAWQSGWFVLLLGLLLALVGLRDDIQHIPARIRLAIQMVVASILLVGLDCVPAMPLAAKVFPGGLLLGLLLAALLLLAAVWWINLFNFMDGIDGLAASQAVFMLLAAAGMAIWAQPGVLLEPAWGWMLCTAVACVGFLLLNWPPAKIFMGDVGSTYLAFMILALALVSVRAGWLSVPLWLVLGALFASDASVTLLTRMLRGEPWHQAHRSHAYQHLARRWGKHRPVTLLAIAINGLWLAPLAWACLAQPQWAWLWVVMAYLPLLIAVYRLGAGRPDRR